MIRKIYPLSHAYAICVEKVAFALYPQELPTFCTTCDLGGYPPAVMFRVVTHRPKMAVKPLARSHGGQRFYHLRVVCSNNSIVALTMTYLSLLILISNVLRCEELQDRKVHRHKFGISCMELTRVQDSYNSTNYIVRCERSIRNSPLRIFSLSAWTQISEYPSHSIIIKFQLLRCTLVQSYIGLVHLGSP